jgi:tetratricopeptide (TPR) repeat protein
VEAENGLKLLFTRFEVRGDEPTEVAAFARTCFMLVSWLLSRPDEAIEGARAAVATAEKLGDPFALAWALYATGIVHAWRGDAALALDYGERALCTATEGHAVLWQHYARLLVGWARSEVDPATACAQVDELLPRPGNPNRRTLYWLPLVELCVRAGREALALETISEAMEFVERADDHGAEPELLRLRGELLKSSDKREAERSFTRAIEVARLQSSRSFELRAAMSLYRFLCGAKKRKALEDVRRVFESFTEGFETRDLLEAKAILAREDLAGEPPAF